MQKVSLIVEDCRTLGRFIIPSMLGMLTAGVYTLVDGLFVGWGAESSGIAALNVAYPFALLLVAVGEMIGIGGAVNIAIARGRNYQRTANRILNNIVYLIIPVAILLPLLILPFLTPLLRVMGAGGELLEPARQYALIILCGGVFQIAVIVLLGAMRNNNAPALAMGIIIVGLIFNVLLDWLFVLVYRWGVAGSAWATVLAQAISCVPAWVYFRRHRTLRFTGRFRPSKVLLTRIFRSGIPSFGVQLSIGMIILLHNHQALRYGGVAAVAAYAVLSYIEATIMLLIQGIAGGLQPVVSFLHGGGKVDARRRMGRYAVLFALALGVGAMVLTATCNTLLPRFFNAHGEVLRLAGMALLLAAPVYPLQAVQKIAEGYFQAMERNGAASLLIYLDSCVILPLCVMVLPYFFGLNAVWTAMPIAKLFMFFVTIYLWRRGSKKAVSGTEVPGALKKYA